MRDASVAECPRREFGKKVGMHNPSEQLEAVHDPWPGSREIGTGIDKINGAVTCRGKRIEVGKTPEQLKLGARPFHLISAQGEDNDVGLGIEHLLPGNLHGATMFAA